MSHDQLVAITNQSKSAAEDLRRATGTAIEQHAVWWWLVGAGGLGVLTGVLLCLGMVGVFPRTAGAWMAATIVGRGPWTAGQTLMSQGDPAAFERMIELYKACPQDTSVDLCRAAMAVKAAAATPP